MPAQAIDVQQALVNYGLDSVLIMETIAFLGKDFPRLRSTALFEFPDIAALAAHLLLEHADDVKQCLRKIAPPENVIAPAEAVSADPSVKSMPAALPSISIRGKQEDDPQAGSRDIAIIGMSGTYPDAEDLSSFWKNLVEGRNSVREVPASRWDIEAVYSAERDKPGTSYGRWGGFLDHADCFDSLFFQISPAQAKLMDPQERLFLQAGWAALEDAGYPLSRLPKPRFGAGGRDVGVFVGAMWDDYAFLAADHAALGQHFTVLANRSGIANQLSYFGDFRGPSMVIDTACSASLVALHQACDSLIKGECAYGMRARMLKRGVFFPARASRLLGLWRDYEAMQDVPPATRQSVEKTILHKTFDEAVQHSKTRPGQTAIASLSPKAQMAAVFSDYISESFFLAQRAQPDRVVDYAIYTGSALGAFNQTVQGTPLEHWSARHVDRVMKHLLNV
ncbi:beta-ketoacyl synthase N-terminal-like domain-containing protein [Agrobacterium vitis]|uniref:beta-ketoacyl synthase N-terminal-like domain-containing protein n=1 Tax=Agrobacterium vitis TaxID=373 RepID=UPI001F1F5163|nr:beta-ketoacyl synthase N-terminal-like domain-containing protein [Agrobacterium vitis]